MIDFAKKKEIIKLLQMAKEDIQRKREILKKYNAMNTAYIPKSDLKSIIPRHLYTCWHTKELPPLMKENYEKMVEFNKEMEFHLYDENECKEFIKKNFKEDVLNAYERLVPCSYKSDLWRYCILYIHGGIYMDIKYKCVNNFKLIELTDKEYFVKDRPSNCTYTALIVSKPGNPILLKCIRKIVMNVNNEFYGKTSLDPTGPGLLGEFTNHLFASMELRFQDTTIENCIKKHYITYKDKIVLTYYDKYREEQKKYQKKKYYAELWDDRNIYYKKQVKNNN